MPNVLALLALPEKFREFYKNELERDFPAVKFTHVDHVSKTEPHLADTDALITFGPHLLDRAEHVFRNIGSAEKRKVFLGESYHMITLDNERDAVAAETNAFFKAHAAATLPQRASAASVEAAAPRVAASGARRQA